MPFLTSDIRVYTFGPYLIIISQTKIPSIDLVSYHFFKKHILNWNYGTFVCRELAPAIGNVAINLSNAHATCPDVYVNSRSFLQGHNRCPFSLFALEIEAAGRATLRYDPENYYFNTDYYEFLCCLNNEDRAAAWFSPHSIQEIVIALFTNAHRGFLGENDAVR